MSSRVPQVLLYQQLYQVRCFFLPPSSLPAPPFLQFVVVVSIINFKPLTYDDYVYPPWANWVGWGIALSSMILVPAYVIYKFFSIRGSLWEVSSE